MSMSGRERLPRLRGKMPGMQSATTIERLGPGDIAQLRALNELFARAFGDSVTYCAQPPNDDYLRSLLGKEHIVVLVAMQTGTVVGGLVAYELQKFERKRSEMYLYDLAVDEAHRRAGVATNLIAHLQEIAARRGAWVIFVQADYGDEPAITLYEGLGVREDVMHFDIELTPKRVRD